MLRRGRTRDELSRKPFGYDHALLVDARTKGRAVSADVEEAIGHLAHVPGHYLTHYPEYEGKTAQGVVVVEELEAGVEELMKTIRVGLTPTLLRKP